MLVIYAVHTKYACICKRTRIGGSGGMLEKFLQLDDLRPFLKPINEATYVTVSQARPTFTKWEGFVEVHLQAMFHYTAWCSPITLQYILSHDCL